jgi:hypothetical protein
MGSVKYALEWFCVLLYVVGATLVTGISKARDACFHLSCRESHSSIWDQLSLCCNKSARIERKTPISTSQTKRRRPHNEHVHVQDGPQPRGVGLTTNMCTFRMAGAVPWSHACICSVYILHVKNKHISQSEHRFQIRSLQSVGRALCSRLLDCHPLTLLLFKGHTVACLPLAQHHSPKDKLKVRFSLSLVLRFSLILTHQFP